EDGIRDSSVTGVQTCALPIWDGLAMLTWRADTFGYAESYDEAASRYRGLNGGRGLNISADSPGLLVKPDVASKQLDAETPSPAEIGTASCRETTGIRAHAETR